MKKIILLGYMGSGKSTIGNILAQKAKIPFIDLDKRIEENEQLSIKEIFQSKGEIYFRKLESLLFAKLLASDQTFVLAVGGGTPCYANNHLLLQTDGCHSIYLSVNTQTLVTRLEKEKHTRPLIAHLSPKELESFVGQHLLERNFFYRFAKMVVDASDLCAEDVAEKLFRHYFEAKN